MAATTNIEWCDSTLNLQMGCDFPDAPAPYHLQPRERLPEDERQGVNR